MDRSGTQSPVGAKSSDSASVADDRYQGLVEAMADVLFVVDDEGRVVTLNAAFERHLGLERKNWVGRHFSSFLHAHDQGAAAALQRKVLAGEKNVVVELRFRAAGDRWVRGELRASPWFVDGKIIGLVGVGRDITQRVRSEVRDRSLWEIARHVTGLLDLEILLNRALRPTVEALHCSGAIVLREDPDTGINRVVADLGFEEEASRFARSVRFPRGVAFQGRLVNGEMISVRSPQEAPETLGREVLGRLGIQSFLVAPLLAHGRYHGALVAWSRTPAAFGHEDISLCEAIGRLLAGAVSAAEAYGAQQRVSRIDAAQMRVAEEMISSLEAPALLEQLCKTTRELVKCDLSHTFLYDETKDAFFPRAGVGETTVNWEQLRTVVTPRSAIANFVARVEREGLARFSEEVLGVGRLMQAYGAWCGLAVPLRRGEQLVGLLVVGHTQEGQDFDVEQENLLRGIGRLASLGLVNAQLLEKLKQANGLKSEFVAAMSHELRTPLNVIMGYSDLLLEGEFGELAEAQVDPVKRLSRSAGNLCELVNTTLDLSRLESGNLGLDLEDVAIESFVKSVCDTSSENSAGLDFSCELAPDLAPIRTDSGKLKIVLGNLLGNAFKFTTEGSVRLSVAGLSEGIEFVVRDTGPGIPESMHEAVFEAFRQGDGSSSRRFGGVGLGLFIVRQLVAILGGSIEMESVTGQGTVFRLWVPRAGPFAISSGNQAENRFKTATIEGVSAEEKSALVDKPSG